MRDFIDEYTTELVVSILGLLVGLLVGVRVGLIISATLNNTVNFRVGECVRELGHDQIEKILAISPKGVLETTYAYVYSDGSAEMKRAVYSAKNTDDLVEVDCE